VPGWRLPTRQLALTVTAEPDPPEEGEEGGSPDPRPRWTVGLSFLNKSMCPYSLGAPVCGGLRELQLRVRRRGRSSRRVWPVVCWVATQSCLLLPPRRWPGPTLQTNISRGRPRGPKLGLPWATFAMDGEKVLHRQWKGGELAILDSTPMVIHLCTFFGNGLLTVGRGALFADHLLGKKTNRELVNW